MAKNYKIPSITDLIESRVHIGHQVKRWHPTSRYSKEKARTS